MSHNNSHFTDLMITKDPSGNADFIFGVDMDRMTIDNSAYSALIADMTDVAKRQIAANSEVLSFNIDRRQVKKELSLNSLGSPQKPEVFSDETISHPVLGSVGEMNEVPITVSGGPSGIKYLTASDMGLAEQTAGTYQYELSISLVDGFIPTISKLLKKLYRTNSDVSDYVALLEIPDNYDSTRKKSKLSIRKAKIDEMSKTYVDALSYFQNLKDIDEEYKRAASLISSNGASKESIGTFQKRLNTVISKLEGLISKTETGVSPSSVANSPSNSSLPNTPTVEIKQSFNNTISVECKDDKYVDYFKGKGKIGGGLNTYSDTEVRNKTPETTYLEPPKTTIEALEIRGVTFSVNPISEEMTTGDTIQKTLSTEKFIGASAISTGGLLKDDLSPIDLSTVSVGTLVNTIDINAAVSSMTRKLSSVSSFQTPADNITKVIPSSYNDQMPWPLNPVDVLSMASKSSLNPVDVLSMASKSSLNPVDVLSKTMVLVASQTSEPDVCSSDSPAAMLKSLEWKSIEEISTKKGAVLLCKQEDGSGEVANAFFVMERK